MNRDELIEKIREHLQSTIESPCIDDGELWEKISFIMAAFVLSLEKEQSIDWDELQKLMDDISEWSDNTFGNGQRTIPILHHLKKEITEIIEAVENYEGGMYPSNKRIEYKDKALGEFADCLTLLFDACTHFGLTAEDILRISRDKLEVNKKRLWGDPDENGVIEHVRQPEFHSIPVNDFDMTTNNQTVVPVKELTDERIEVEAKTQYLMSNRTTGGASDYNKIITQIRAGFVEGAKWAREFQSAPAVREMTDEEIREYVRVIRSGKSTSDTVNDVMSDILFQELKAFQSYLNKEEK